MTNAYKKTVTYMRYSTHNQDDGFSIEYQRAEMKEYADKHGLYIDEEYIDEAKTGTKVAGRDGFYNLVRAVKDGHIQAIIVYKLSRLFRNVQESQYYRELFRKHNVKLLSVTQIIDEETSAGRMTTNILSVVDQYQSEITSDHVKSSMREMARQGYYTGGLVIYGYDLEDLPHGKKVRKRFIPNDDEAQIVNKVFELYAKGHEVGYIRHYINNEMNAKTRRGGLFYIQLIHKMLKNDFYIGVRRFETEGYDKMILENSHPAIISMSLWDTVQERLHNRPKIKPRKHPEKRTYPLTGLLYCSCGSHCMGISGKSRKNKTTGEYYEYFYYACSKRHYYTTCKLNSIRREEMHRKVIKEIRRHFLNKEKIDELSADIAASANLPSESIAEQLKQLGKEKADIEKQLNVLIDMRLNGEMSGDILRKRSTPLEERLPKIEKQIFYLKENQKSHFSVEDIKNYLSDLLAQTEIDYDEVMRSIFLTFVEKVVISNTTIEVSLKMSMPKKLLFNITSGTPFVTLNNTLRRDYDK